MSKQGLFARHYASNQTLIMVKVELLQGILARLKGRNPVPAQRELHLAERKTAHPLERMGGFDILRRRGH
jgi:hypothetical protein